MQPFSLFFEKWISNYYKSAKIGKDGDFYTSVSTSKFFGGCIAKYIINRLECGYLSLPLNIIDLGGNDASLLCDIYDFLEALSDGIIQNANFILVESNNLNITPKNGIKILKDLSSIEKLDSNTIFIANEFFDSLPCELYFEGKMLFVDEDSNIEFLPSIDLISNIAENANIQIGEIPLSYVNFIETLPSINTLKQKWLFLVFDYGDKTPTNTFNIRIFHKHKIIPLFPHSSPSLDSIHNARESFNKYFAKADITYNVPFGFLESLFSEIGAKEILFKKQDLALIEEFKILDLLSDFYKNAPASLYLRESNKIKTLLSLSHSFKAAIYANF